MSKNVLIISSSMRKNSNSEALAEEFAHGAAESGNSVEIISLKDKKISFCIGCLSCGKTQRCVIDDDARKIAEKMLNADVICFASPVYYYSISGQLKTLFDRANPLYSSDYKFRDIYLLSTAAEDGKETVSGFVTAVQGWVDCFEKAELKGVVFAGGVNDGGDIKNHSAMKKAFEMGKNV